MSEFARAALAEPRNFARWQRLDRLDQGKETQFGPNDFLFGDSRNAIATGSWFWIVNSRFTLDSAVNYDSAVLKNVNYDRQLLYVMPQTGHGLSGTNYTVDGDGKTLTAAPIPNGWNRVSLLTAWGERGVAPGLSETVTAGQRSLPLCSYPIYPKYVGGSADAGASYGCTAP